MVRAHGLSDQERRNHTLLRGLSPAQRTHKKDAFPLPRIDDSLNSLSGQAWFSTLDLASEYWQVRLSEDAKPKIAFATHSGLFQFAVMPFGLCNAPATFERLMSEVMRGLHWKRCLVYIDDILVFGHDFESALHSLELVLIRVAEYGLQLKSTKPIQNECTILGTHHRARRPGMRPKQTVRCGQLDSS